MKILNRWSGAEMKDVPGETLSGADLSWADLRWADLRWADLSGAKQRVIRIDGTRHQITAIDDMIQIGCQSKKLDTWLRHYEAIGKAESYTDAEIAEYGAHLLHIQNVLTINPATKAEVAANA